MADLRNNRGVPAKRGLRVTVDGKPGIITSARGWNIMVRFDGLKFSTPCHPRWRVIYHLPDGDQSFGMPEVSP